MELNEAIDWVKKNTNKVVIDHNRNIRVIESYQFKPGEPYIITRWG